MKARRGPRISTSIALAPSVPPHGLAVPLAVGAPGGRAGLGASGRASHTFNSLRLIAEEAVRHLPGGVVFSASPPPAVTYRR
jgi:hypothetical protein